MTNKQLIDKFLAEKSLSAAPRTYSYYKENLEKFYTWYVQASGDSDKISFLTFTKEQYSAYLIYLKDSGIKNTSLSTYHRAVRTFCNWLVNNEYLDKPWTSVKLPRPDPEPIIPLTIHEVKLIDSALNNYHDIRDYCMLHLMLDCGLRRQEVINLKQNDCFFGGKNKYIIIRNSKYNKSRMVPVPDFLVREISGLYHPCNFYSLFHSLDFRSNCITIDVVKKLFRNLKKESGVMRLHPHLLRHTFATSFIAGGGNMEYLRLYLGHSDYSIVQNYLHISLQTQICGHDIYRLDKVFFKNYNMQDN